MADLRGQVRAFALSLPEAVEDFPWGESVAKVRGKVFVFLGGDAPPARTTVKLDESHGHALAHCGQIGTLSAQTRDCPWV